MTKKLWLTFLMLRRGVTQVIKRLFAFLLSIYVVERITLSSYNASTLIFNYDNAIDTTIDIDTHSYVANEADFELELGINSNIDAISYLGQTSAFDLSELMTLDVDSHAYDSRQTKLYLPYPNISITTRAFAGIFRYSSFLLDIDLSINTSNLHGYDSALTSFVLDDIDVKYDFSSCVLSLFSSTSIQFDSEISNFDFESALILAQPETLECELVITDSWLGMSSIVNTYPINTYSFELDYAKFAFDVTADIIASHHIYTTFLLDILGYTSIVDIETKNSLQDEFILSMPDITSDIDVTTSSPLTYSFELESNDLYNIIYNIINYSICSYSYNLDGFGYSYDIDAHISRLAKLNDYSSSIDTLNYMGIKSMDRLTYILV